MFNLLMNVYSMFSAADSYIIGFTYNKILYAVKVKHIADSLLNLEKASRNQGMNLRLRIRKAEKLNLLNMGAVAVGSEADLIDSKYNKGECFERIITERFGQEWYKDTVPFWEDGDIEVNGEKIQIKLDGATLLNSKQANKLLGVISPAYSLKKI